MPVLDAHISIFVNGLAHHWWTLDMIVEYLQSNLLQGTTALAIFYFVWFQTGESPENLETAQRRVSLLFTLLLCVPAVLATRALAASVPYRVRPIFNPDIHLRMAYSFDPSVLLKWSSFPSDHAVLFFTLATGTYLVGRKAGLLLYAHAIIFVCLPRIYLGVHYPSDILTGAAIGCGFGYLSSWAALRSFAMRPVIRLQAYSLGVFYACLFILAFETAYMFDDLRHTAVGVWHVFRHLV